MDMKQGTRLILGAVLFAAGIGVGVLLGRAMPQETTPTYTVGERYQGEFTTESPVSLTQGTRYQALDMQLPAEEVTVVSMESAFPGTLTLLNSDKETVARAEADPRGSGGEDDKSETELAYRPDAGGTFTLVASAADSGNYGPFSLSSSTVTTASGEELQIPGEVRGWLQEDANTWTLEIDEAGLYRIAMTSSAFDTYLELNGQGISQENDDGGNNTDSELETYLEPGEYEVTARSYREGAASGLYTLTAESRELPDGVDELSSSGSEIAPGERIVGIYNGRNTSYRLNVEEAGLISLDLGSSNFDTMIRLRGQGLNLNNDDGGTGTDSYLQTPLEPGTYTVQIDSFGGSTGLFNLEIGRSAMPENGARNSGEVTPGTNLTGRLQQGMTNTYELVVENAGTYVIGARSDAIDTYIELSGNGVTQSDDDGGSGFNSRMNVRLEPGTYQLGVRAYSDRSSGTYQLEVR